MATSRELITGGKPGSPDGSMNRADGSGVWTSVWRIPLLPEAHAGMNDVLKSISPFVAAGVCEIGRGYLVWQ